MTLLQSEILQLRIEGDVKLIKEFNNVTQDEDEKTILIASCKKL